MGSFEKAKKWNFIFYDLRVYYRKLYIKYFYFSKKAYNIRKQ